MLPRVLVLSSAAVVDALLGSDALDAVLLAPEVPAGWIAADDASTLGKRVAAGREAKTAVAWASQRPRELAARLLEDGRADAALIVDAPLPEPRLRVRDGARALRVRAEDAAEQLRAAVTLLELGGARRPRVVLFGSAAAPDALVAAAEAARATGVDLRGPLSAKEGSRERADLWVGTDPLPLELALGFLGSGAEASFSLCGRWASAGKQRSDGVLAAQRLADLAMARGDLAVGRDPTAPVVSVLPRPPAPARGRCPYCHRFLNESPDGRHGAPGPPLVCEACGTGHHRDCLSEHGECTVLGCESARFTRLGVVFTTAEVGGEDPREWPFASLPGDAGTGPAWLRIEAPLDDARPSSSERRVRLELPTSSYQRGERVQGNVWINSPRDQRVSGALVELRSTLITRERDDKRPPRVQTILARQACFLGERASALGRLTLNMANLLGGQRGVQIPAGVRRYPFSFELPLDHPRSVRNRQGGQEEDVRTRLVLSLGGLSHDVELEVR